MAGAHSTLAKRLIVLWTVAIIGFLYIPMVSVVLASFSRKRYFSFPINAWDTKWYEKAFQSLSVRELLTTSLNVAVLVTIFSVFLAFLGALAFARYDWKGRKLFQKVVLLPIFFPQAVLGLALLLWFSALGITTSWQTAVFAHMIWIVPIVTLIISIQVYSFDPALEEAAFDLGASRWQVLREVTLPILSPGLVSGSVFAFLLSWGNFPLSLFTTGADQTVPEWLYAKMVSGYTPMVPTLGSLTMGGAVLVVFGVYLMFMLRKWRRGGKDAGPAVESESGA